MNPDPHLEQYLALCKRMYLRMQRENSWPWLEDKRGAELPSNPMRRRTAKPTDTGRQIHPA